MPSWDLGPGPSYRRLGPIQVLKYRAQAGWWKVRPLQRPKYSGGTPKVGRGGPGDFHLAPTAQTVGAAAMSQEASDAVVAVLAKLTPDDNLRALQFFYEWARAKYGHHWRFANLPTTLWAAATVLRPTSYLEIGILMGHSCAVVGTVAPDCAIYGFDLWIPGYAGSENPGPDFVKGELKKAGHRGQVTLVSGDSHETLPQFLREHPDLYFDLITIDGDKSMTAAASDYAAALPRLKVGGIVISDDIASLPRLRRIWKNVIRRDARYVSWDFVNAGRGVSAAVRISE